MLRKLNESSSFGFSENHLHLGLVQCVFFYYFSSEVDSFWELTCGFDFDHRMFCE
jgi:hypothetical protein